MLNHLDLFSGIGGISLGFERTGGIKTVGFCEIDTFCQSVLKKHWPDVPIYNDVRRFEHDGAIDVITGGYPCQGESLAGERQGAGDDRWLWPEMFNCVKKFRPSWVVGENVFGHISMGLDTVLSDLESWRYTCRAFVLPALSVDARHRRDRVIVVAHSERPRLERYSWHGAGGDKSGRIEEETHRSTGAQGLRADVPDPKIESFGAGFCKDGAGWIWRGRSSDGDRPRGLWPSESGIRRVANGIPHRMDRLKSLGNSVVPQLFEMVGHAIIAAEAA
jgi:DNA (cytosine-5)-methyltransferase 1